LSIPKFMGHKTTLGRIIVGVDGKVTHVKCKVYNVMEMQNRFWCPNWIICGNMLGKRRPKLHLWVWQWRIFTF